MNIDRNTKLSDIFNQATLGDLLDALDEEGYSIVKKEKGSSAATPTPTASPKKPNNEIPPEMANCYKIALRHTLDEYKLVEKLVKGSGAWKDITMDEFMARFLKRLELNGVFQRAEKKGRTIFLDDAEYDQQRVNGWLNQICGFDFAYSPEKGRGSKINMTSVRDNLPQLVEKSLVSPYTPTDVQMDVKEVDGGLSLEWYAERYTRPQVRISSDTIKAILGSNEWRDDAFDTHLDGGWHLNVLGNIECVTLTRPDGLVRYVFQDERAKPLFDHLTPTTPTPTALAGTPAPPRSN